MCTMRFLVKKRANTIFVLFLPIFLFTVANTFSQDGPGGVGATSGSSNLVLWLNPDTAGNTNTLWKDASTNSYDFTSGNGATLTSNNANGYNTYSFNGSSNYFDKSYENTLNPTSFSIFTTTNVVSTSDYKAVVSSRENTPSTKGFILYALPTNNFWSFWTSSEGDSEWRLTGNYNSTAGNWSVETLLFSSATNGKKLYINNGLDDERTNSFTPNSSSSFRIGAGANENPTPSFYYSGQMGEIIMFDVVVNTAQRTIINNYLSAKYGFLLGLDDFYTQDDFVNGDYDHDVAGIGQATDGSNHTNSRGTGIIRMHTPSDLDNDEFLFWGRNDKESYSFTTSSSYVKEGDNTWRVAKRSDLGTVSVEVDLTGIATPCSAQIVVDNDADFSSPTNTYTMSNTSGNLWQATGVSFTDNDYFRIAYTDDIVVDGTQFYNGSGAANVPNTADNCYKLLVKNTATGSLALTENANVKEVEVESGGKLVVNTNRRLQVTNGITNNGEIRMIGDAQLIQTHTGGSMNSGSGMFYQDQTSVTTSMYQSGYWSSPVTTDGSTFTIAGVLKDGTTPTSATSTPGNITFSANTFDGDRTTNPITLSRYWLARLTNTTAWTVSLNPTTETFNPGEGWNMKGPGGGTQNYTFVGRVNDGEYSLTVDDESFSLIGNPYPSAIDADEFIDDNNRSVGAVLYFWNAGDQTTHNSGNYTGSYHTRVVRMGTPSGTTAVSGISNFFIPVAQAFFVYRGAASRLGTGTAGTAATITFKNSQRAFKRVSDSDSQFFGKVTTTKSRASFPILRLGMQFDIADDKVYARELAIGFRGLDNTFNNGYDAPMFDLQSSDMALQVSDRGTNPYVITGIEDFDIHLQIPITVYMDQQREVTFKIKDFERVDASQQVYLYDAVTEHHYKLREAEATITIDAGTYTDRFYIMFNETSLGVDEELLGSTTISYQAETSSMVTEVAFGNVIKKIEIYNYLGKKVAQKVFQNPTSKGEIASLQIPASIYIVRIQTNKGFVTRKVVVTP